MRRTPFQKPTIEQVREKQEKARIKKGSGLQRVKRVVGQIKASDAKITAQSPKKKRKKKTERKKAEETLWGLCRQITFKRYGNTCYTTGQQNLEGMNLQCGHGKPKGALPLKYQYDLRNLRPQNYHSNINLGGMADVFIAKLEQEKEGLEFLQESCVKVDGVWRIKDYETMSGTDALIFLKEKIKEYEDILEGL